MLDPAPIALFVYLRPEHTRRTLTALAHNDLASRSPLYVFCDGEKNDQAVQEVREVVAALTGFASLAIVQRDKNRGLASSIVDGVTEILQQFDRVIVLEDDMVTSSNFLRFCNDCLQFYQDDPRISAISGYSYPIRMPLFYEHDIYVARRGSPWGWATWRDRWEQVDWSLSRVPAFLDDPEARRRFAQMGSDLEAELIAKMQEPVDAWSIARTFSQFENGQLTLYPRVSKLLNIGCDASGTNFTHATSKADVKLDTSGAPPRLIKNPQAHPGIERRIRWLFGPGLRKQLSTWMRAKT